MTTAIDARSTKIDTEEAWKLLKNAKTITTAKGEKVQNWNPQSDAKEAILGQAMGPSGNLRAPTLRLNDEFIVGFNAGLYEAKLGKKK